MERLKLVVGIDDYSRIVFADNTVLTPNAEHVEIGVDTYLAPDLEIGMPGKTMKNFIVGDHCRIFKGQIAPYSFRCGDYVTIHQGVWCYGRSTVHIGHNSWFGMRCTLDAEGRFHVGNGFGAGQDTHLWTHIRHGDTLMGCQYLEFRSFVADDDVWFVGRCTSAPAYHQSFSVALTESNVTRDMERNHVYGGNPARDLTEKIGTPYKLTDPEVRIQRFQSRVIEFMKENRQFSSADVLETAERFLPADRVYKKENTPVEVALMRYLLPEAKFTPEKNYKPK